MRIIYGSKSAKVFQENINSQRVIGQRGRRIDTKDYKQNADYQTIASQHSCEIKKQRIVQNRT